MTHSANFQDIVFSVMNEHGKLKDNEAAPQKVQQK